MTGPNQQNPAQIRPFDSVDVSKVITYRNYNLCNKIAHQQIIIQCDLTKRPLPGLSSSRAPTGAKVVNSVLFYKLIGYKAIGRLLTPVV